MEQKQKRGLLSRLLLVQLVAVGALFVGVLGTAASAGTTISAGSASIVAGGTAVSTASVTRAAEDSNFNAFDITLQFDPAVASVATVEAAAGWSLMPAPRINNTAGTVQVIAVRFDECATNCPVFKVTWNGLAAGTSALTLGGNANESLAGMGQYITASFSAGSLTVTAPPTPSPTAATPSPTTPPSSTPSPSATPSPTASPTATPTPPETPAPGAPASVLAGSGGAASGSAFTTTAGVSLGASTAQPATFDLTLTFDPGVATVNRVTAGAGWSLAPQPSVDNATGTVHVSALRFEPCASYCPLFVVEWQAVASGSTLLTLQGSPNTILSANGVNQPANFKPGALTVSPAAAPQGPSAPATATPSATPAAGSETTEPPALPVTPGWNLVTWGGGEMTPQQALSASNPSSIEVIYVWDPESGKWRRYGPSLPSYLNDLKTVKSGDVIWLSAKN